MPKKSKREKIKADIRRQVTHEHVLTVPAGVAVLPNNASAFQFRATTSAIKQPESYNSESELIAIKKDLVKTISLATIAIAAELALYWFGKGKV